MASLRHLLPQEDRDRALTLYGRWETAPGSCHGSDPLPKLVSGSRSRSGIVTGDSILPQQFFVKGGVP